MGPSFASWLLASLAASSTVQAYFLMGANNPLTTERIDPIVNKGAVSDHVHTVFGGSNFRLSTNTSYLRQSECSSVPIVEDNSNYWVSTLYFQWKNGSFTSVNGDAVIEHSHLKDYLFDDKPGSVTAFPDDFRMLSGDSLLRTYDSNSYAQQAITFLCLDFNGVTSRHNELPKKACPSGIRSQINFPMCWDGKNTDSSDHKSHVAFPSEGPDKGDCTDPKFPVKLPRIFMEMYWSSPDFKDHLNDAMNPEQPFVFSNGDPTGYGYHGDFVNGWDRGVLQKVVDNCSCDPNGSLDCCAAKGIFTLAKDQHCRITKSIDEPTTGTLPKLPGNNPVQKEGKTATKFTDSSHPQLLSPVYVYRGDNPDKVGKPVSGSGGNSGNDQTAPPSSDGSNDGTQQGDSGSSTSPTSSTSTSSPTSGSNGTSGESQGSTDGSQQGGSEASAPPTSPTSTSSPSGTSGESQGSGASGNGQDGGTNQSSGSPAYPPAPGSQQGNSDNGDAQGSDGTEGAGGSDNHSSSPVTPPTSTSQDDNHSGVYTGGNASEGQTNSSQSGSTSKTCSRKKKRNTKKRSPRGRRHFHESAKRFDSQQF